MRFSTLVSVVALFAIAAAPVYAQSNVSVNFRVYGLSSTPPPEGLCYKSGQDYVRLSAAMGSASRQVYNYSGPATMQLFVEDVPAPSGRRGGNGGGNQPPGKATPVGKVTFNGNGDYIVAVTALVNGHLLGGAVKDSAKDFPNGTARLLNLTPYPLSIVLADKNAELRPEESLILPTGKGPSAIFRVFWTGKDKKRIEMLNDTWAVAATGRYSGFIYLKNTADVATDANAAPDFAMMGFPDAAPGPGEGMSDSGSPGGGSSNYGQGRRGRRSN